MNCFSTSSILDLRAWLYFLPCILVPAAWYFGWHHWDDLPTFKLYYFSYGVAGDENTVIWIGVEW